MEVKPIFLVFLTVAVLDCEACRPSADNILELYRSEVDTFHSFVYSRTLLAEERTCDLAEDEDARLREHFSEELNVVLARAEPQAKAIKDLVKGTDAEDCVAKMYRRMKSSVKQEVSGFERCRTTPRNQLNYLKQDLDDDSAEYKAFKSKTKTSFHNCLLSFPGECAVSATPCLKEHLDNFHSNSKQLTETWSNNSRCMVQLEQVLQCFTKSAGNAVRITDKYLKSMKDCSSDFDKERIAESLDSFFSKFSQNTTLEDQVKRSQQRYWGLYTSILDKLGFYYSLEKAAKLTYEFRPHDLDHFQQRMDQEFSGYLRQVESVRRDKEYAWATGRADSCCDRAKNQIQSILSTATKESVHCEKDILTKTRLHISDIRDALYKVTHRLSDMGNVAILDCLKKGYILAENAVEDCYELELRAFQLDTRESLEKVDSLLEVLRDYNASYFSVSEHNTPCGDGHFNRTKLSLDRVMFRLSRCPYSWDDEVRTTPSVTPSTTSATTTMPMSTDETTEVTYTTIQFIPDYPYVTPRYYLDGDYSYFFEPINFNRKGWNT